jgi:peptide/nickel transport system permease protein
LAGNQRTQAAAPAAHTDRGPALAAVPEGSGYSRDYWDGVFEQLGRRFRVRAALVVLAVLYALAIYAPLLANDRPFYLAAVDLREFQSAQRSLSGVTSNYIRLLGSGEAAFLEKLTDTSQVRDFRQAVAIERGAIDQRLDTLRSGLPDDQEEVVDALVAHLEEFERRAAEPPGPEREAAEGALRDDARALRSNLTAFDPRQPEAGGIELEPSVRWPLLETVSARDMFFMVLWLWVLTWPLWNRAVNRLWLRGDRERIRRARRRKLLAVLSSSALLAAVWAATVGGKAAFETSTFKEGLSKGEIVATAVVMPPIAMGFAETHLTEVFRPPTWHPASELDEQSYYVRGNRVPRPDPVTGALPPSNPVEVRRGEAPVNSGLRYPLGTDSLGRDLTARLLWGARISLVVGLVSTSLLVTIGIVVGSIAGYSGGWVDIAVSRVIEVVQSFPAFFLILVAVAVIPSDQVPPIYSIVIVIALVGWTGVARLVRGEFLKLKAQDFVVAARAMGFSTTRVVFRHVLPNALGPVLVAASFAVAQGILIESSISFLGLGIKLPVPSWGTVINDSREPSFWWIQVFPGFLIFTTIFAYNLVGEGLRDALDPRMKV